MTAHARTHPELLADATEDACREIASAMNHVAREFDTLRLDDCETTVDSDGSLRIQTVIVIPASSVRPFDGRQLANWTMDEIYMFVDAARRRVGRN
jgi:hypothetical protein